ncbi:MAG: hypothetical protein R3293_08995 [Candidatus Promineifilaceae bacterium]|nr:hypothetical protein [Candidatus Promineifilaceae bacterium]
MKNGRIKVAILSACLLYTVSVGHMFAQGFVEQFDLAVTEIESLPVAAGVGDDVTIYVTYENLGPAAVPSDLPLDIVLTMADAATRQVLEQCGQPVNLSGLTASDGTQRTMISDCSISLLAPETFLLRAEFVEAGKEIPAGPFSTISGDLDSTNNGSLSSVVPAADLQTNSLPADLARIFAGLALLFAVMALVAAGTEVVIDSLKVGVGLKRKITSMEALERMEKYLPGELATLSVSAASREQYKRMAREMRRLLDHTLVGHVDVAQVRQQIAGSEFGAAYGKAEELIPENGDIAAQDLYKMKKQLFSFANLVSSTLENQLQVRPEIVQPFRDQLAQEISLFDGQNPGEFLQELFITLQNVHFWSAQIADGWLSEQQEILFDRSSHVVITHFETEVRPLLLGVGFNPESVDQVQAELASRLRIVEAGVSQTTDTFVSSVKNVLDAVEVRRYETQSPARKIWRILRSWQGGVFPPESIRGIFVPSLAVSLLAYYFAWLIELTRTTTPLTRIIANQIPDSGSFAGLPWLILLFAASFIAILILYLVRNLRDNPETWFVGLYGATALAILTGLFLLAVVWVLQASSDNRVAGVLTVLSWTQPWWSWLILLSVFTLILLLLAGQIGKTIYERLVRSAVRDGRIAADEQKLKHTTTLLRVETFWNLLRHGFDVTEVDPDTFNKAQTVTGYRELATNIPEPQVKFSAETTAQFIMQRTDQQRDEETSRLRVLRVISIIVGLILAYILQIDVLKLLGEAFPGILESINLTVVSGETLNGWRSWLPAEKVVTVGIILTGFAASAGSAFWHDRLDKLQASKKGAQAAATLLSQASQVAESVDN